MYVAGAPDFDATDGGDWASDPIWEPRGRYFVVPEIAALAHDAWREAEHILARLVRELRPHVASIDIEGVGCGFDDGDATVIWEREKWTLWADVGPLGQIDITVIDQPWKHGRWTPDPAFADFASRFDQSRKLLMADDIDAWLEVDASLKSDGVHMRYPNNLVVPESILHIDGTAAWFRWNDEPFEAPET